MRAKVSLLQMWLGRPNQLKDINIEITIHAHIGKTHMTLRSQICKTAGLCVDDHEKKGRPQPEDVTYKITHRSG